MGPRIRGGSAFVIGIICFLAAPSSALAVETEQEFLSMRALSAEQRTLVSRSGTEILGHVMAAQAALDKKDWIGARRETAKARSLVVKVSKASPALRVQDEIHEVLSKLDAPSASSRDLLPIYAELDTVSQFEELAQTRKQVDQAADELAKGNREGAGEALIVASTYIAYLEIDLPIDETRHRLSRALIQMHRNDFLAAGASLREAMEHVKTFEKIVSTTEVELLPAVGAGDPY